MRKKIIDLILVIMGMFCMFMLVACEYTEPVQTMKVPVIAGDNETLNMEDEVFSYVKEILPDGYKLLKITSITEQKRDCLEADLTGDEQPELFLGFQDEEENVGILILQKDEQGFKKLYMKTFDNYDYQLGFDNIIEIKTAQLLNNQLSQVVVSYNFYESDHNYLSVHILGFDPKENVVKNYFSLLDLPQAKMEVLPERIIIKAMGISKEYSWDGQKFLGKQIFDNPKVKKDDVVIHYAMSKRGHLTISEEEVTLNVGQRLLLIRDDQLEQAERIMLGGDDPSFVDILNFSSDKVYTAQKPGVVHITIVPNGGYDWDNAKEIKITVQ